MNRDQRQAVRSALLRLGMDATPQQVAEHLASYGVVVSETLVAAAKMQMLRQRADAERERAKRPPATKARRRPQQRKIPRQR